MKKSGIAILMIVASSAAVAADKSSAAASTALTMAADTTCLTSPSPASACLSQPNLNWVPLLSTTIKTSATEDLIISVSALTALFSSSSAVTADISNPSVFQDVGLKIEVLVDGVVATPGVITFDDLIRSSSSAGSLFLLTTLSGEMTAKSFNFFQRNVGVGTHTVQVQGIFSFANANSAYAASQSAAMVGARTLVVNGVTLN